MITEQSTFEEIFGDYFNAYTPDERRQRWEQWKSVSRKSSVKYWQNTEACKGCVYLDVSEAWCKQHNLPCTLNRDFGFSMLVMSCKGLGKEVQQKELFISDLF